MQAPPPLNTPLIRICSGSVDSLNYFVYPVSLASVPSPPAVSCRQLTTSGLQTVMIEGRAALVLPPPDSVRSALSFHRPVSTV